MTVLIARAHSYDCVQLTALLPFVSLSLFCAVAKRPKHCLLNNFTGLHADWCGVRDFLSKCWSLHAAGKPAESLDDCC